MAATPAALRLARCNVPCSPAALERLGTVLQCEMDETVCNCTDQARDWYWVVTGAARRCSLTADGRRQIVDFLLPGDLFGFGSDASHHISTEVIVGGTTIARYPLRRAEQLAESDPQVGRWVREKAFESISRLQSRMLILGRPSALARVSAFLLDWTSRADPSPTAAVTLPMSRYDIADYLAIAVETVSRALTTLRERKVIVLRGTRGLRICDRCALEMLTEGVGSEHEEPARPH